MMRSMFSAISGLRAHQNWMDVIGNNIANVNTTGFKVGRVRFQDILNQTMRGASNPTEGLGGTNPMQIGLGVAISGIDTIHTQGALQATGRLSDLAIQGEGFFVMSDGTQQLYTRDGAFDVGVDGRLVNPSNGMYVMGWPANDLGVVDSTRAVGPITIPLGQQLDATMSTAIAIQGNVNAAAATGDTFDAEVSVVDSLGFTHDLTLTFEKTGTNAWSYTYTADPADATLTNATGSITFTDQGTIDTVTPSGDLTATFTNGAADVVIPNGGDFSSLSQLSGSDSATAVANGSESGGLMSFAVTQTGGILGVYSNGTTKTLGQVAIATVPNPGGLSKSGANMYSPTANSGDPILGIPGGEGRGSIASGYLEMSNVDLAEQFTSTIMAQRGFQANSRVITTSDEILQELVNLKR